MLGTRLVAVLPCLSQCPEARSPCGWLLTENSSSLSDENPQKVPFKSHFFFFQNGCYNPAMEPRLFFCVIIAWSEESWPGVSLRRFRMLSFREFQLMNTHTAGSDFRQIRRHLSFRKATRSLASQATLWSPSLVSHTQRSLLWALLLWRLGKRDRSSKVTELISFLLL